MIRLDCAEIARGAMTHQVEELSESQRRPIRRRGSPARSLSLSSSALSCHTLALFSRALTISMRRTISSHTWSSPLFKLPAELLPGVLSLLAPADLAALARTARCLREPCARALYAHVRLDSYDALCALVCALETRPALGVLVRGFAEAEGRAFLVVEPRSEMLARAVGCMPRLRALALASPIDVVSPDFASSLRALSELETLRLGDATPETLEILAHIRPVRTLSLRRSSVGWSTSDAECDETALATYLLRTRDVLRTLEIDGRLLEPILRAHPDARWPNVRDLTVYEGGSSTVRAAAATAFPNARQHFQKLQGPHGFCSSEPSATWETGIRVENAKWSSHFLRGPLVWILLGALSGILFVRSCESPGHSRLSSVF